MEGLTPAALEKRLELVTQWWHEARDKFQSPPQRLPQRLEQVPIAAAPQKGVKLWKQLLAHKKEKYEGEDATVYTVSKATNQTPPSKRARTAISNEQPVCSGNSCVFHASSNGQSARSSDVDLRSVPSKMLLAELARRREATNGVASETAKIEAADFDTPDEVNQPVEREWFGFEFEKQVFYAAEGYCRCCGL